MGAALVGVLNIGFIWAKAGQLEREYQGVRQDILVVGSALLVVIAITFGKTNPSAGAALGALGFALGYIDACTRRLPLVLTALLGVQILIYGGFELTAAGFGVALWGAALWLLAMGVGKATKAVGTGDVYLAPILGFFAGPLALVALTVSVLVAGVQALLTLRKGVRRFPFGPALVGGTFVTWLVAG